MGIQSQIILESPAENLEDARDRPSFNVPKLANAYLEIDGKRYRFLELLEPLMAQAAR